MPTNNRLFYAVYALGVTPFATPGTYTAVRGLQSVGVNTKFNLDQVFEIGQLAIYENVEQLPDVELTVERVLDGYPLFYHLMTKGATAATLIGRSNVRGTVAMSIYSETVQNASGLPLTQVVMSGLYVSQLGYNFQVNGPSTEQVTCVGNNKVWATGAPFVFSGMAAVHGVTSNSPSAASGVNFRQDLVMPSCTFPKEIPGINGSGKNVDGGTSFPASIQSIKVSANLGRESMLELGRLAPYFRYVNFPVEVTCAIEVYCKDGDMVSMTETGYLGNGSNTADQTIYIQTQEGTKLDLGTKNRLTNVAFGGANAGGRGGNATSTYSYVTFNDMTVTHPADPTVGLAA